VEKKLYCVKVVLYVMAENASGACVAATKAPFDIFECTARKAERVEPGWENAVPYNADDDRTCAEILAGEGDFPAPFSFLSPMQRQKPSMRAPYSPSRPSTS
jgi:hypothetical protein